MNWYAVNTKPNKEEIAWRLAGEAGHEIFYPRLAVRPVNPRSRRIRPYFPGYLFVRADLEVIGANAFRYLPHIRGLVEFGGEPAIVPVDFILALKKRIQNAVEQRKDALQGLARGDRVLIEGGPLHGYEAAFDERISGRARVRVLLSILGRRPVPVVLNADQVVPRARTPA